MQIQEKFWRKNVSESLKTSQSVSQYFSLSRSIVLEIARLMKPFVLSPCALTLQFQTLYCVLIQERFQRLGFGGVVVRDKRFVELFHVLVSDSQNTRPGLQQDFVCQRQAGTLVAVPEKLSARTPAEGVQRLFCRRGISGKNRGQLRPDSRFLRH